MTTDRLPLARLIDRVIGNRCSEWLLVPYRALPPGLAVRCELRRHNPIISHAYADDRQWLRWHGNGTRPFWTEKKATGGAS